MDDNGTKVLPKKQPPLLPNRILPTEEEIDFEKFEGVPESKVHDVNDIKETQRSEQAPPVKEALPPHQPSFDQTIEGKVKRFNEEIRDWEECYIVLYQQHLSVFKGDLKESEQLHEYAFPHGAEYLFSESLLYISDKNGKIIRILILEKQLFTDILMKWLSTKLFSNFKREQADEIARDDFDEKTFSLQFNPPSFREFDNVYNKDHMTPFYYYPIVDGKRQITNGVEFKHFYRPNRLIKSYEQEYGEDDMRTYQEIFRSREKIEEYITNRDRKFIQWAPSRDWSRLIVLSSKPNNDDDSSIDLYLEFYNFNNEKQTILSSPLRINFLSQLLRPQWIQYLNLSYKSDASELKIEASFTADTIVIRRNKNEFMIYYLSPELTYIGGRTFRINDANIESIKLSCSKLYIKSNEFYYEQQETKIYKDILNLEEDFSKDATLKNIIQCGIYDILIYDGHVKICSNIDPLNQFDQREVDDDMLKLLNSSKFIPLDHDQIACLPSPLNQGAIPIKIITISKDNLVVQDSIYSSEISIEFPLSTQPSDCQFNLIKFKEREYAVLIVYQASKNEQSYQYYRYENRRFQFAYQKPLNDHINLEQIPHLPLVAINGSLFINCDRCADNYQLELDLLLDEQEILNQDQENINSQQVEVYLPNFKNYLFRFIEEKEEIIHKQTQSDGIIDSIYIPELKTSIFIQSSGENSGILIFQPSFEKIKHLKIKKPIHYKTHKVIYRDSSYKLSIILSTDDTLYEIQMCFDLAKATLTPLLFIMNFTEAQKEHEIYLHDDFKVSLFIFGSQDFYFKHFSYNQMGEKEETIKIDFEYANTQITIPYLSSFIQRIANSSSISFGKFFLKNFKSIIFKNLEGLIINEEKACVFAFQNKFIIFEKEVNCLILMDNSFNVIGTVILSSKFPPFIIRIASAMDPSAIECLDDFNNKFPIPILGNLWDSKSYNEQLNYYTKNFRYPMPIQFGLLDGFISHLDLQSENLLFYNSNQEKKRGKIVSMIKLIARRESFIDEIIQTNERQYIEEQMNKIEISYLLSYNVNKRMNLITGTKNHAEKDHIYSILYTLLDIAEIKELPILIYNTSVVPNKYESILDILIENKAIKLARLIVKIAIKQDQIGYIYSRLYQYLFIFSANELQMFFENQIFFFKIPLDCYRKEQIVNMTQIVPFSDFKTFYEIKKNMKNVESQIQRIEEGQDRAKEIKDSDHSLEGNEKDQLQISQKVSTEYFAINLMTLIQSQNRSVNKNHENHRDVTKILNTIVDIDENILLKESLQIIIDFKWKSYARNHFAIQLGLFICFIIAFILDVMAVRKSPNEFQSDDKNQVIARIISIAFLIPFFIFEISNILIDPRKYFHNFWNLTDVSLIVYYVAYFSTTFSRPELIDVLKSLQLLIVIFSFIKFSFLIRIFPLVSFPVRMLEVVFRSLFTVLIYFLLVIGGFSVMAYIIINEPGEQTYDGIKSAAQFMIVLRQAVGDYDTSSIIDGSEFQIMAWFLWLLILIVCNIIFMNFIIAYVSESYALCNERKMHLIYGGKLEMITECENAMPDFCFNNKSWFPRFIIIRREQITEAGGQSSDEQSSFVQPIMRHLDLVRDRQEKVTADVAEVKKETAEMKVQINEIQLILSAVFKDQIALMKAQEVKADDNKAI